MPTRFPIFIIDASSYLSRVYYHPQPKILDKNIENITVYNFCRMLRKLASRFNFAHIVIVWDGRKEIKPSIGFLAQKKLAMEFVDLIKMEQIMQQNIAAYDTIFSMVTSFNHQHHDVIIVTDNKNFFSLVNDATTIFDPFAKVITQAIINREFLEKKYKFPLEKFPFFLALAGDTTGHISGVYGIGEKRAGLYIQRFNNLDDLYKNLNKIIDLKIQAALIEGKQNAYDSFEQATPHHHQNPTTVARTTFHEKNWQLALPFFEKHHYNKLISDIKIMSPTQESIIENISATHKPSFDLVIVTTKEQLITMTRHIKKSGIFSINAQGSQLDPMASMPLSISIAIDEKSVYYIPLHDEHYKDLISQQDLVASLKNVLLDAGIEKIINRAQYSLVILSQLGLTTNGPIFDITNAASFTMHDFDDGGLAKIINIYTHQANLSYQNNSKQLEAKNAPIAINQKTWYGIADVHLSRILKKPLEFQLINEQVLTNFQTIEMPITTILADMEITGICCNRTILERLDVKLADDIMKITQEIHRYCPTPININSTLQVRALLFETLKLPVRKKLSKTRSYSTDSSVLKELSPLHPIPGLILKYRELHKYQRPYIANLLQCINNKTHKIHPIWEQALGKTSRITATHPNIQSVPTKDLGYGIYIRSAFHAQENNTFIAADYNDIELRLIAHLSQDKILKGALARTEDIHTQTAAKLFGIIENKVSAQQRFIAKKINLSIAYGLTAYGLAKDQNIPYRQAAFAMRTFFAQFPCVRGWLNKTIEKAKYNGYVTTIFGRKRYIPSIRSKNRVIYDAATRLALNTIIQGSACEIVKIAMIHLNEKLHAHRIEASILLHLHDQLVLTTSKSELERTKKLVFEALTSVVAWDVGLKVTIITGNTWQDVTIEEPILNLSKD